MSRDSRKKERQRLKRKQKKREMRRQQSRTALRRIAGEGGTLECWITPDWREEGIALLEVLGHVGDGRCAFAAFLVDLWCVGLKDAFGRGDVSEATFREESLKRWIEQTNGVQIDPGTARRLVAGAIRFGRQNGFRLPPGWEKWVSIFGRDIFNELPSADLADFGVEGGLRYVGTADFLRQRLSGCTAEQFLARPEVQWIGDADSSLYGSDLEEDEDRIEDEEDIEEDEIDVDEEQMEEMRRVLEEAASKLADATRTWCQEKNIPPQPLLDEAAFITVGTMVPLLASKTEPEDVSDEELREGDRLLEAMVGSVSPDQRNALVAAAEQLRQCMREHGAARDIAEAAEAAEAAGATAPPPDVPT